MKSVLRSIKNNILYDASHLCAKKETIAVLAIFIIVVFIKGYFISLINNPWIFADEAIYFAISNNIINNCQFFISNSHLSYPPGYSIALTIPLLIGNNIEESYLLCKFLNIILTSLMIFPTFYIIKRYSTFFYAIMGTIITGFTPSIFVFNSALLSENFNYVLVVLILSTLILCLNSKKSYTSIILGILCFIAYITRMNSIGFFLGIVGVFIFLLIINQNLNKDIKKHLINTITFFIIPFSVWQLYSKMMNIPTYRFIEYPYLSISDFFNLNIGLIITLVLNQLNGLFVGSFFFFFLCFIILIFFQITDFQAIRENKTTYDKYFVEMSALLIFSIISTFFLLISGLLIQYPKLIIGQYQYSLYLRYIDPTLYFIVIFGTIGLYNISNRIQKIKIREYILFSLITLCSILLLLCFFPPTGWNNTWLWYLSLFATIEHGRFFLLLLVVLFLAIGILIIKDKKVFIFLTLFIVMINLYSINSIFIDNEYSIRYYSDTFSNNYNIYYNFFKHEKDYNLLFDDDDFSSNKYYYFCILFWNYKLIKDKINMTSKKFSLINPNIDSFKRGDYIISTKGLDPLYSLNNSKLKLYRLC